MFLILKDIWNWLTNQAFNQLIALVLISLVCFAVLLKYPIEFERTNYKVKQNITVTETTTYLMQSEISEKGAKLMLQTKSYIVEVRKEDGAS
jgi:hypothetical protein